MKKFIILLNVIFLSACVDDLDSDVSTTESSINSKNSVESIYYDSDENLRMFTAETNGITYRIFMYDGWESGAIFVVNETKELMEMKKLSE
jgi:hypothetical protein